MHKIARGEISAIIKISALALPEYVRAARSIIIKDTVSQVRAVQLERGAAAEIGANLIAST